MVDPKHDEALSNQSIVASAAAKVGAATEPTGIQGAAASAAGANHVPKGHAPLELQEQSAALTSPAEMERSAWWGQYTVPPQRQAKWQLGPLSVCLQHMAHEWRLATKTKPEAYEKVVKHEGPRALEQLASDITPLRYCFSHMCDSVRLVPALPDRAVVTKPDTPLYVYPGEQVTLYLSFPLWLRVEVGEPSRLLKEVPLYRLSDTWFGPNTREGELCYASRTAGTINLSDLVRRSYRASTAVVVRNKGLKPLYVERLNVNLPYLSLYADVDSMLWTNALVLEQTADSDGFATLQIEHRAPSEAKGGQFIVGPRQVEHRSALVRAFSSIMS
jgi:hypothetical protein